MKTDFAAERINTKENRSGSTKAKKKKLETPLRQIRLSKKVDLSP